MTLTHVPLVVYGASGAGLGLAAAFGSKALLVERTALIGQEWIASYTPGRDWHAPLESAPSRQLREELLARHLLNDEGFVHLPAMPPTLFRFVREKQLQVKMMTEIINVERDGDRLVVTLHNASGLERITTDRLIDTTPTAASSTAWQPQIVSRSLRALMAAPQTETDGEPDLPSQQGAVTWEKGLMPGEAIVRFPLEADQANWQTARAELHSWWQREHALFAPWTLAAVADAFELETHIKEQRIEELWDWFPTSSYANLLQAFDAGYRKGCQLHETVLSA